MIETSPARTTSGAGPARSPSVVDALPQIGGWQPTALIGEGMLTRVFQAQPANRNDLPACYAVKILREEWEHDHRAVALIRREAHVGRALSHPHVVSVLAHSAYERPYFIAMPLLSGSTLADQLRNGDRPSVPVALWIARQVAEGLDGLYGSGLMHSDVNPTNIFVAPDGHVTLIDLGYACPIDEHPSLGDRPVVGTMQYMAPEILTSALAADTRSDIYSLGITLYEMLLGTAPFVAADPAAVAVMQREAVPRRLDALDSRLPARVADLVQTMLAKEPLRRPQTPRELADLLAALEIEFFALRPARINAPPAAGSHTRRPAGLAIPST